MGLKFRPLNDKVLVRPDREERSKGGVYFPNEKIKFRGEVLAVGPGRVHPKTGERVPLAVKPGDRAWWVGYVGDEITLDGEELKILSGEDHLLAVLEP